MASEMILTEPLMIPTKRLITIRNELENIESLAALVFLLIIQEKAYAFDIGASEM
jgi:hypothetical protein